MLKSFTPVQKWTIYAAMAAITVVVVGIAAGMMLSPATPVATSTSTGSSLATLAPPLKPIGTPAPIMTTSVAPPGRGTTCEAMTAIAAKNVSREFVLAVGDVYSRTEQARTCASARVPVRSPVTGKEYEMTCIGSNSVVTCTGGDEAMIQYQAGRETRGTDVVTTTRAAPPAKPGNGGAPAVPPGAPTPGPDGKLPDPPPGAPRPGPDGKLPPPR